jgi:3-oxoacyl-[acyl-carrier protein] reductase
MDLGLTEKVAIVTGASQGLGFATARALADEGCRVIICSRKKRSIESAAKEIRRITNGSVLPLAADVSDAAAAKAVVDTAVNEYGTVHILVNNVGGPPIAEFENITDDKWQSGFELVLMSMIRFNRLVLPYMKKQSWGRIVTISSIAARQPIADLMISSALRPGIHSLNKMLTERYASKNISFNAVAPGFILTRRQEEILESRAAQQKTSINEQLKKITEQVPARRMGKPEELAAAIAFLVSEKASYISGATLSVDGGLSRGLF